MPSAAILAKACSASCSLPPSASAIAASNCAPALRSPLILIVFVAAPAADAGHHQHHGSENQGAIPVPDPPQALTPDFLIDFVKDIGQALVPGQL